MTEERVIEIETRIAWQEDLLQTLNQVVTEQQARIDQLEKVCRSLVEHLQDLSHSVHALRPGSQHEVPPHY